MFFDVAFFPCSFHHFSMLFLMDIRHTRYLIVTTSLTLLTSLCYRDNYTHKHRHTYTFILSLSLTHTHIPLYNKRKPSEALMEAFSPFVLASRGPQGKRTAGAWCFCFAAHRPTWRPCQWPAKPASKHGEDKAGHSVLTGIYRLGFGVSLMVYIVMD